MPTDANGRQRFCASTYRAHIHTEHVGCFCEKCCPARAGKPESKKIEKWQYTYKDPMTGETVESQESEELEPEMPV